MFAFESFPDADQCRSLRFEAQRLRALADDLDLIADDDFPDDAVLSAAPILDDVAVAPAVLPVLTGAVTGHPLLTGTGRIITTSIVEVISPAMGWARTRSRFYRLGRLSSDTGLGALSGGRLS